MVDIKIDVKIGKDLQEFIDKYREKQELAVRDSLIEIANEFINTIKFLAPRDTGKYADSWVIQNITNTSVRIGTPLEELAVYLEYGTAPHPIVGHRKVLHWTDEEGDHFAFYVRHPGFPAIPHIRPALNVVETKIPEIVHKNLRKHLVIVK